MRARSLILLTWTAVLAACGSDGETVTLRGDFAGVDPAPTRVLAVEAEREAEVRGGAFELSGLTAGPVTLRLLSGDDTVGTVAIHTLAGGTALALRRLRVDPVTRRAFPVSVELDGASLVAVNGIRMAGGHRLPREIDAAGTVLAATDAAEVFLLRPDDGALPDLRVVLDPGADVVTPDGDPVEAGALSPGDSVRVEGRSEQGFVLATRLTVPRDLALRGTGAGPVEVEGGDDGGGSDPASASFDGGGGAAPVVAAPVSRVSGVRAQGGRVRAEEPKGRGRGGERGGGRGGKKPKD